MCTYLEEDEIQINVIACSSYNKERKVPRIFKVRVGHYENQVRTLPFLFISIGFSLFKRTVIRVLHKIYFTAIMEVGESNILL